MIFFRYVVKQLLADTSSLAMVIVQSDTDVRQLTLVCLIAVVGEIVGNAANQTQLACGTGRGARHSWHWLANVRMPDSEFGARLLRGTAGMAADVVRHDEDQARERRQQNKVSHLGASVVGEAERKWYRGDRFHTHEATTTQKSIKLIHNKFYSRNMMYKWEMALIQCARLV